MVETIISTFSQRSGEKMERIDDVAESCQACIHLGGGGVHGETCNGNPSTEEAFNAREPAKCSLIFQGGTDV